MSKIKASPWANIRTGPGIQNEDIGNLMFGQKVNVLRSIGEWSQVEVPVHAGGAIYGWVYSPLISESNPIVIPNSGNFVGMHDFPDDSYWHNDNKRGWVVHTVKNGENLPTETMRVHRSKGGRVCIRVNWDYGQTFPSNESQEAFFYNWIDSIVAFNHEHIDAIQIGNEPEIEAVGYTPERIASIHTKASNKIVARNPNILISPAPFGWLQAIDGGPPQDYILKLWSLIKTEHRRIKVLHAYRHGAYGDPNQVFTDWPLVGVPYNEKNIEFQISELDKGGFGGIPILVGETNYGAPEHENEPDAWQDDDNGATIDLMGYFASISAPIIGVCPFRWKPDEINGRSYGIQQNQASVDRLRTAQSMNLKGT